MLVNSKLRKQKLPKVTDRVYIINIQKGKGGKQSKMKDVEHDWFYSFVTQEMIDLENEDLPEKLLKFYKKQKLNPYTENTRERNSYRYAKTKDEAFELLHEYLEEQKKKR